MENRNKMEQIKGGLIMLSRKVALGLALLFAGVVLMASMVYQELVEEEPEPEDYHMQISHEKWVWRIRDLGIFLLGVAFNVIGIAVLGIARLRKGSS